MKGLSGYLFKDNLVLNYGLFEVVIDLRVEYPDLKLGIITPFMGILLSGMNRIK